MSWITDEMRAAVGSELGRSVSYPIAASDIRRWAVAVYHPGEPPRIFWDEHFAAATPFGGIVAPEEFNPFAWMTADPPGLPDSRGSQGGAYEIQLGLAPVGTSSMLNGGLEISYGARMRPGDVITSTTTLTGYDEREGRLGLMLFTRTSARWFNQRGDEVKTATMTLIRY
jgi:hypothetical protein